MASVIEIEASFYLDDGYDNLIANVNNQGFEFEEKIVEEDTYYTDKSMSFIKDRICLRTRKTNEEYLELTYKPKTDDNTEKYGKKEVNLSIDPKDSKDVKYVLNELGYDVYVSFKKKREIYSKTINGFKYSVMIDEIENVGRYVELEILAHTEEEKEKLHDELDNFVESMGCNKLREKDKPYRDIVKEYLENTKNN